MRTTRYWIIVASREHVQIAAAGGFAQACHGKAAPGFAPHRRDVHFLPCAEVDILPLIGQLSFITDKRRWGAPFRFGLLEIQQPDFDLIAHAMLPEH